MAALRRKAKKTQDEIAKATGIDRSTVIALEKGRRPITPTYAERIAPELDVSPEELLPPAGDEETDPGDPLVRLAQLEAAWNEWAPLLRDEIGDLTRRVRALEQQGHPNTAEGDHPQ